MSHIHFTKEIRETLAKLLILGFNNNQIGNKLGMHRSSIGREIKRNSEEEVYKSGLANRRSIERRYTAKIHILDNNKLLLKYVESKLNLDWSPSLIRYGTYSLPSTFAALCVSPSMPPPLEFFNILRLNFIWYHNTPARHTK